MPGKGALIWHKGPVDRPPRLTLLCFFFYPSGYLDAGEGRRARPPCMVTNLLTVGTEVYGDGRGKHAACHFGSGRPTQPIDGTLLSRAHTTRRGLCLPFADAPACVVQGLMSRVRGVFPSLLPAWAGCSPPSVMSPAQKGKKVLSVPVTTGGGAALHCIRSSSCHPSPRLRESVRCNAMRETFTASSHHCPLMFAHAMLTSAKSSQTRAH